MFEKYLRFLISGFLLAALMPGLALADLEDMSHLDDKDRIIGLTAGYRWISTDDNGNRASEYSYLDDSPTFGLVYKRDMGESYLTVNGTYLNHNDYKLEMDYDYKAQFRFNARTERMYHNLDHFPYVGKDSRPDSITTYTDLDPGADYGRKVTIDNVKMRAKLPNHPAHINLEVWRMERKGHEQVRFVDESCTGCHMQSDTREIKRITEEVKFGVDTHLGPVDIAFLQTLRKFKEEQNTPANDFNFHVLGRSPGNYLHNETPDSKLSESTFMINLPQSGGFVTSASYTYGKRENQSELTTHSPIDAETTYDKLAADVTYTPSENWTFNFRYRMLDLDADNPDTLTSNEGHTFGSFGATVPVRESIDIDRDNYAAYVSYRPSYSLTLKGEYEREEVHRSDTGVARFSSFAAIADPVWAISSKETTDRFRLSFNKRMLEKSALKLSGWYEYVTVDNPAYGNDLSSSNEVFLSASYKPAMYWGLSSSLDILRGSNDDREQVIFDGPTPVSYSPERDEASEKLSVGVWYVPNEVFSADLNYGLLHSKIEQDVIFGQDPDAAAPGSTTDFVIFDDDADYEQLVHTLAAGINLRASETVSCRLEGYHIRSSAEFSPGFPPETFDYSAGSLLATADDLKEISEVDLRQNGVKARLTWKLSEMLHANIEYAFDDFEDRNSSVFDGSVQTVVASLAGTF